MSESNKFKSILEGDSYELRIVTHIVKDAWKRHSEGVNSRLISVVSSIVAQLDEDVEDFAEIEFRYDEFEEDDQLDKFVHVLGVLFTGNGYTVKTKRITCGHESPYYCARSCSGILVSVGILG